jgi:hypothetical protein
MKAAVRSGVRNHVYPTKDHTMTKTSFDSAFASIASTDLEAVTGGYTPSKKVDGPKEKSKKDYLNEGKKFNKHFLGQKVS